ncbi:MAG: COG4315 family predicted lipoprotein [Gaiellaceae bacterium]
MSPFRTYSALVVLAAAAALALAACGSDDSSDSSPAGGGGETVSVASVDGVGDVLVDPQGAALYSPDQEAGGKVLCTDACTSIWVPLTLGAGDQPIGSSEVSPDLGVVRRPDGAQQVTYKEKPLYTFVEDPEPGTVTGDGFTDDFEGTTFTWHVAAVGPVSGGSTGTDGGYGY